MDWLGFIASVIGSLAWPGVVPAQVLNAQLREVLPRLERDNPRKREWG
jgi:hypothetical protein